MLYTLFIIAHCNSNSINDGISNSGSSGSSIYSCDVNISKVRATIINKSDSGIPLKTRMTDADDGWGIESVAHDGHIIVQG